MFGNHKTRKVTIMNKYEVFDLKIREDIFIKSFKEQISKYLNISFIYYYLFYNEANLLESFDGILIRDILLNENDSKADNLFYIVNKEEYNMLQKGLNFPKCKEHPYNISYLICFKDKELICDKCRDSEKHKQHTQVSDQALILESYFMKLNQFEKNLDDMLNEISEEQMNNICEEMKINLRNYKNQQAHNYEQIENELKSLVMKVKELETQRFDSLIEAGRDKIFDFEADAKVIFDLYKLLKEGKSAKNVKFKQFQQKTNEEKIEFLCELQNQNFDLINKIPLVKTLLEKINNIQDYDVSTLLDVNKDNSFFITFTKIKQMLSHKINHIEAKTSVEDTVEIIGNMESLKSKNFGSKVYNRLLNLDLLNGKKYLIQPLDGSLKVNVFDFDSKKLFLENVNVLNAKRNGFPEFPKFSRVIKIRDNVYVTGGEIDGMLVNYFIEINTNNFECRMLKGMDFKRSAHTAVNINNSKIIVISGAYGEKSCEYFDFTKECWFRLPSLNTDRIGTSALVYNCEEIYCFFGKNFDIQNKKWNFIETVERINLQGKYPVWEVLNLRNKIFSFNKKRSMGSFISFPNERVLLLGGQLQTEDGMVYPSNEILELDFKNLTFSPYLLYLPRPAIFSDPNFYIFNTYAVQFDNTGSIFFYSMIFNEVFFLENY